MNGRTILLVGCVAIAACADVAAVPAGTCGNGVVESSTEDCDSLPRGACGAPTDGTRACRLLCDSADCPSGWACAPDHACVHGSRQFEAAEFATSAELGPWTLADVDADTYLDLVGLSGRNLEVRYGDGTGIFSDRRNVPVGGTTAWLGDADGTGRFQAAIPTVRGVAVLEGERSRDVAFNALSYTPDGYVEPPPDANHGWTMLARLPPSYDASTYKSFTGDRPWPECDGGVTFRIRDDRDLTTMTLPMPLERIAYRPDDLFESCGSGVLSGVHGVSCLGAQIARVDPPAHDSHVDHGSSLLVAPAWRDHALLVPVTYGGLCIGAAPCAVAPAALELPADWRIAPHAVPLATQPDATGAFTVFVPAIRGAEKAVVTTTRAFGDETAGKLSPDDRFAPDGNGTCTGFPLAAADLDQDGELDFVMPHGICMGRGNAALESMYSSSEVWLEAVIADLDGNGTKDIAAVLGDSTGIEVVYMKKSGGVVSSYPLSASKAEMLRSADLDGDDIDDLVFARRVGGSDQFAVDVAFGADLALPRTVATVSHLDAIEAGHLRDFAGSCDEADDLVLTVGRDDGVGVVPLFGDRDGAIYAPFALSQGGEPDLPHDVVLGRAGSKKAWLVASTGHDGQSYIDIADDVLRDGRTSAVTPLHEQCAEAFKWMGSDVDGDGIEEAVGVDDASTCAAGGVRVLVVHTDSLHLDETTVQVASPASAHLREFIPADLDLDGALDLLLARDDGLVVLWGDGGKHWTPSQIPLGQRRALSVAVLDADSQAGKEVAVATDDGVHLFAFEGRGATQIWDSSRIWRVSHPIDKVRAGDVNGDGVDDLAVSDGQSIQVLFGVPHRTVGN